MRLEVGAEGDVPYGVVASVVERADKVGVIFARIIDPRALATRPR